MSLLDFRFTLNDIIVFTDILFNEAEALLKLSGGDDASFEALYKKYSPGLYLQLIKLLRSSVIAEDILQDVFIIVWNNREKINSDRCFKSYLSCIAVNKCYDHYRKMTRSNKLFSKVPLPGNHCLTNDEVLINKEESVVLYQTIELLPPKRRLIFQLCKVDGKSYEEVSNQLGISISTISDHIVKANNFIRSRLLQFI